MRRRLLLLSVIAAALAIPAAGQPLVDSPALAHLLDAAGFVVPIHGLAGNFIAGRPGPGPGLLSYSNDGDIEWRLEPGRLTATRGGQTAVFPTNATRAQFRGNVAVLSESNESLRLAGDMLVYSSDESNSQLAGRSITWSDGKLHILQPDGSNEDVECLQEPDSMTAAAANWAHVVIQGRHHLLRLAVGRAQLFVLPQRGRE